MSMFSGDTTVVYLVHRDLLRVGQAHEYKSVPLPRRSDRVMTPPRGTVSVKTTG